MRNDPATPSAIPEPSTWTMLASGLAVALLAARRHNSVLRFTIRQELDHTVMRNLLFTLATLSCFALPSWADEVLIPFSLSTADPTFNRPLPFAQGGTPSLSPVGTVARYTVLSYILPGTSNLFVSLVDSDGASVTPSQADTVLVLYGPGGFNPATPLVNAIMANDDAVGVRSRMVTTTPLSAGNYSIVVATFDNIPFGSGGLPWSGNVFVRNDLTAPSAIPEPSSAALLAAGAAGVLALRRRRRQQQDKP